MCVCVCVCVYVCVCVCVHACVRACVCGPLGTAKCSTLSGCHNGNCSVAESLTCEIT